MRGWVGGGCGVGGLTLDDILKIDVVVVIQGSVVKDLL